LSRGIARIQKNSPVLGTRLICLVLEPTQDGINMNVDDDFWPDFFTFAAREKFQSGDVYKKDH
jgi:hypothetical protein